jgi:hypothetical protein
MNIKQALKRKNKLVQEIKTEFSKVQRYNSVIEGTERVYDPRQAYDNYVAKVEALISLKTAIHRANQTVYAQIFKLSELKSAISQIRGLDCEAGQVYQRGGYGTQDSTIVKQAEITVIERDRLVANMEAEIEKLQEELDRHNALTEIDWSEE